MASDSAFLVTMQDWTLCLQSARSHGSRNESPLALPDREVPYLHFAACRS